MNLEDYKGVFIYAQQVDNEISPIAFELLGKAKELAAPLNAVHGRGERDRAVRAGRVRR